MAHKIPWFQSVQPLLRRRTDKMDTCAVIVFNGSDKPKTHCGGALQYHRRLSHSGARTYRCVKCGGIQTRAVILPVPSYDEPERGE
jgi:hypothetical protein